MRRYETIFIADPEMTDDERNSLTGRLNELILKQEGTLLKIDDWGQKRLAYEIKKKQRGHYIRLDYCGTGSLVDEMERLSRIDDKILKYMTVLLEKNVDTEAAKEEIAREEAEREKALAEKAEVNQEIPGTSTEKPGTATAKEEDASPVKKSKTDPDIPESSEGAPESDEASVTKKESNEKEQ